MIDVSRRFAEFLRATVRDTDIGHRAPGAVAA